MPTFEDVVIEGSGAPGRTGGNGAPIADAVTADGKPAPIARARGRSMEDKPASGPLSHAIETLPKDNATGPARVLPASVKEKIAALVKGARIDTDDDDPDDDGEPVEAPAVEAVDPDEPDDEPAAAAPKEKGGVATSPEWELERTRLTAEVERHKAELSKMQAAIEQAKKTAPAPSTDRLKRIEEAEETYVRNPVQAFKTWLASVNGFEPGSKEHDKEFHDFFVDLTSEITGAKPEASHQSERSSALIRREWDRQKKKAPAEEQKVEQAAPREQGGQPGHQQYVPRVTEVFEPLAKNYPTLTRLAKSLHDRSPEDVIAEVVDTGFKNGTFKATDQDADVVAKAAQLAEEFYKRRRDEILGTDTSTAKPDAGNVPAADATVEREKTRQGKGTRVTSADASAAPAAPPATKPNEPAQRKFRDDDERKRYILRKHLGKR